MQNLDIEFVLREVIQKISMFEKNDDAHEVTNSLKYFQPNNGTSNPNGNSNDDTEELISDTSSGFGDSLEEPTTAAFYRKRMKIQTSTPEKKFKSRHLFSFALGDIAMPEEKDEDKYLNDTIEEAISKYENAEEKFKEVSVQTNFKCGCNSSDTEWLPLEKYGVDETKNPDYNKGSLPVNRERNSLFLKTTPRIRVGLSKRAKPQPLHNKLIY